MRTNYLSEQQVSRLVEFGLFGCLVTAASLVAFITAA